MGPLTMRLDQLIDEFIEDLTPEERVLIANMNGAAAEVLRRVLDTCIGSKIGDDLAEDHPGAIMVLWERLRESHRLRVVKWTLPDGNPVCSAYTLCI